MNPPVPKDPSADILAEFREGIARRGIGWRLTDRWWEFARCADHAGVDPAVLVAGLEEGSSWQGVTGEDIVAVGRAVRLTESVGERAPELAAVLRCLPLRIVCPAAGLWLLDQEALIGHLKNYLAGRTELNIAAVRMGWAVTDRMRELGFDLELVRAEAA